MKLRSFDLTTILDAKAATGVDYTNGFNVEDWRSIVLQISSSSGAQLTIKVLGSVSNDAPNFSAVASASNHYDTLNTLYLGKFGDIKGDTGLVLNGDDSDQFRNLAVNTEGMKFINVKVTAYTSGNVTVKAKPFTND